MRIGVIIPTYNRRAFVERTIESALAQTRPFDDILVVDDGSTDGTAVAVAAFVKRTDGLVRYHRRENGGLSAARNTGQALAAQQCDALLFLDSDDLLMPTAVERLERALRETAEAPLAFCHACYVNADDQPLVLPNTALRDEPQDGDMWKHLLRGNCIRTAGGVLLRRAALNRAGPWDETLNSNEDWDMWLRLAEHGKPFVRVPEPLLRYRIHGSNMSGNRAVMRQTALRVYEKQIERHAHDASKLAEVRLRYHAFVESRAGSEKATAEPQPVYIASAAANSPSSYTEAMYVRHIRFRSIIERTGIAALYRKIPLVWRLHVRSLFGINPNV